VSEAHIAWARGGEASIVSMEKEAVVLRSTVPSPPGSRIEGVLCTAPQAAVRFKVHGCRREGEGQYRIEGRALDLTRELRERLVGLAAPSTA
jgi:hypothetical protein